MRKKLRNFIAGMIFGLTSLAPMSVQALDIKPHGEIEISYVPNRTVAFDYGNETKGKVGAGWEAKINSDLSFSLNEDIKAYVNSNFSKIDYLEKNIEGKIDYKNLEFYISYSNGGSFSTLDLKDILSFGARFRLGNEPDKNSEKIKLNSYGILDTAYVPSRQQYGIKNSYEVKTSITGNIEIDYRNFFVKVGGTERTYENSRNFFNFNVNTQEYETYGSIGYGNFEIYGSHECDHLREGNFLSLVGTGEIDIGGRLKF